MHHVRKIASQDWMDGTSGTNGVNGAADFTFGLFADREPNEATISVTGRDVTGGTCAVHRAEGGPWNLTGGSLASAAQAATAAKAREQLGEHSISIVSVLEEADRPLTPKAVAESLGLDNSKYVGSQLGRLAEQGRVRKVGRGLYEANTFPLRGVWKVRKLWKRNRDTHTRFAHFPHFPHPLIGRERRNPTPRLSSTASTGAQHEPVPDPRPLQPPALRRRRRPRHTTGTGCHRGHRLLVSHLPPAPHLLSG